jgi:hypothetical protein
MVCGADAWSTTVTTVHGLSQVRLYQKFKGPWRLLVLDVKGVNRDELDYLAWKKGEDSFRRHLDRDIRDCYTYAYVMGFDPDYGGAMFELGPMEIVSWAWELQFDPERKVYDPWQLGTV